MRCKNCGWPNESNVSHCVKCNAPLQGSMVDSNLEMKQPFEDSDIIKSTIRESSGNDNTGNNQDCPPKSCPHCGYPVVSSMSECPICHTALDVKGGAQGFIGNRIPNGGRQAAGRPVGGTINPWAVPNDGSFCTLRRIPWQKEQVIYEPVSYSGDEIVLNRANTDANNNSITSREQAALLHENGEWFIENRSDLQTTLLRVDRRIKLEDGDVIMLGNRMFEFRKS